MEKQCFVKNVEMMVNKLLKKKRWWVLFVAHNIEILVKKQNAWNVEFMSMLKI